MEPERTSLRITPQLILGLIVVFVGTIFTLDNLGVLDAGDYLSFWPVGLVLIGMVKVFQKSAGPGKFMGVLFIVAGFLLLLDDQFDFDVWDLWPLALVFLGGLLIWQALRLRSAGSRAEDRFSLVNAVAVLGGVERSNGSPDFRGGELTAFMGGCEIDLRSADIQSGDAVINLFAMWGGIDLRIPESWTVVIEGMALMGALVDKTHHPADSSKRLVLRGLALMGGVEVKN